MKRYLFLLFACSSFVVIQAQNVADLETLEKAIKPGAVLTYDVNQGGKSYKLIATIKKMDTEIVFDWKYTEPYNQSGKVTMSSNAVSKADAVFSMFVAGESKLENETALFLSKKVCSDVQANTEAMLKVTGKNDTLTRMSNTIAEFGVTVDGNFLSVPGWELQGGSEIKYTIDAVESQKFPLITKLDMGWTVQLLEIKSQ